MEKFKVISYEGLPKSRKKPDSLSVVLFIYGASVVAIVAKFLEIW